MGTDVIVRSNHLLSFKDKTQLDIVNDVLSILNSIDYVGFDYFFEYYFDKKITNGSRVIYKARVEDEYYSFERDGYIEIESNEQGSCPHLDIDQFQCSFLLPFRYRTWCTTESNSPVDWRSDWRRYIWITTAALGGDRAIYLADNGHPLEAFDYSASFREIELALFEKYGEPATTLKEAYDNSYKGKNNYYIDRFQDLIRGDA